MLGGLSNYATTYISYAYSWHDNAVRAYYLTLSLHVNRALKFMLDLDITATTERYTLHFACTVSCASGTGRSVVSSPNPDPDPDPNVKRVAWYQALTLTLTLILMSTAERSIKP
mgnify:CR=1 FL=1